MTDSTLLRSYSSSSLEGLGWDNVVLNVETIVKDVRVESGAVQNSSFTLRLSSGLGQYRQCTM